MGKGADRTSIRPEPGISCSDTAHSSQTHQPGSAMKCEHEPCRASKRADRRRARGRGAGHAGSEKHAAAPGGRPRGVRERFQTDGRRPLSRFSHSRPYGHGFYERRARTDAAGAGLRAARPARPPTLLPPVCRARNCGILRPLRRPPSDCPNGGLSVSWSLDPGALRSRNLGRRG